MTDTPGRNAEDGVVKRLREEREALNKLLEILGVLPHEARKRILDVAKIMAGCVLAAALVACGDSSRARASGVAWAPTVPPGAWQGDLRVPAWLAPHPDLIQGARDEIAAAALPPGYRVVIMDPGQFSAPSSPTGLAMGLCDAHAEPPTIYVAWRFPPSSGPALPMLQHEAGHARAWEATHDEAAFRAAGHDVGDDGESVR